MTYSARVSPGWLLASWRDLARHGLCAQVDPEQIHWYDDSPSLIASPSLHSAHLCSQVPTVSSRFFAMAEALLCHNDVQRWSRLYRIVWRLTHGERRLLEDAVDVDMVYLQRGLQQVRRDCHKMKAFVRFREVAHASHQYVAWFEPDHYILDRVAPFFMRRFTNMHWTILTPYRSVRWNGTILEFGEGASRDQMPNVDAVESLWLTYYANIFNPARPKPGMMRREMPTRYWRNLPEAALIPLLERDAGERAQAMVNRAADVPKRKRSKPISPAE